MRGRSEEVENLFQSVVTLQNRLRQSEILSAVIGGIAVAVWGEPRLTRDVDIKVLLGPDSAQRLLDALGPDYLPLIADPLTALTQTGVLFVQDVQGTRLDLLLSDVSFDAEAIRRAREVALQPELVAYVCSPEDLIIYKLISTRQRDHEDAEGVVRRQGEALDDDYVLTWLRRFEQALGDSTLVATYRRMRARWS
jgi:hypothetical protein